MAKEKRTKPNFLVCRWDAEELEWKIVFYCLRVKDFVDYCKRNEGKQYAIFRNATIDDTTKLALERAGVTLREISSDKL